MASPDIAFQQAANAADAAWRARPAYITYDTRAVIDAPSIRKHQTIERAVQARTSDDIAIVQDLPRGRQQIAHAFPLLPTFDALSYFRLVNNGNPRDALESYVEQRQTVTFAPPTPSSTHVDVVVTSLRNYYASYAPDSTDARLHIDLKPLPALTTNNSSDFYLHDIYIDTSTYLPSQVTYTGHDERSFTVDYATIGGHWVVNHVQYGQTFFAPLHIGRVHVNVDASFDHFTFPTVAPDPRLAS